MTRLPSPRQWQILQFLVLGDTNREIGTKLGIAEGTVKIQINILHQKLGLKNRVQLAVWALKTAMRSEAAILP